jgi:hypothetical protein
MLMKKACNGNAIILEDANDFMYPRLVD